jgi:uncharacterized protein (TIGR03435 family)
LLGALVCSQPVTHAQAAAPLEFDVVSIKPSAAGLDFTRMQTLPDFTFMMTNSPLRSIVMNASPVDGVREVLGLPDWANTERYDITAKPPAGTTREQLRPMWQALLADRMKLVSHIEQQERTTFAMVLARSDGHLGPQLKKSTLDCSPPAPGAPPTPPPAPPELGPNGRPDFTNRCGMMMGPGTMVTGGVALDRFAQQLGNMAGGFVTNKTGLDGFYAFTLNFTMPGRGAGPSVDASGDAPPEIFTALQEQLGLKLQPEKTIVPILVIDHIERPTPN